MVGRRERSNNFRLLFRITSPCRASPSYAFYEGLYPAYLRSDAFLAARRGAEDAAEV